MDDYSVNNSEPVYAMQGGARIALPAATITSPSKGNVISIPPGARQIQLCPPSPIARQVTIQNLGATSIWLVSGQNIAPVGRRISGGEEYSLTTDSALYGSSLPQCVEAPIVVFS